MAWEDDKKIVKTNKLSLSEKWLYDKLYISDGGALQNILPAIESLAWQNVLMKIYGDGDPIRELDSTDRDVRQHFLDWADKNRLDDLDDLLYVAEEGVPLPGNPSEATLRARRLVRDTAYDPKRLAALIYYMLASTLRRWEEEKSATPEQIADFLLGPLGADPSPTPRSTAAFVAFGVRLWRLLQSQKEKDIGYWKTVRGFGDFFVRTKGGDAQVLAARAYETLIKELGPQSQTVDPADLIRGAANNLVSIFDELAGRNPAGATVEAAAAAACLHLLAGDAIEERRAWSGARRRLVSLDELGNTPLAFQQVGSDSFDFRYLRQAWFSARAACARARLREPDTNNAKDVAAAFFNAGVALLRRGGRAEPAVVRARVTLNVLGVFWSLLLALGDEQQALGPYNGGDCAVNLFGALTDLDERQIASLKREIGKLFVRLARSKNAIGEADWQKIKNSSIKLSVSDTLPDSDTLLGALVAFMIQAGQALGLPQLSKLAREAAEGSGQNEVENEETRKRLASLSWLCAARSLQPLTQKRYIDLVRPVWQLLNRRPPTLQDLPDAIAANWTAFLDGKEILVAADLRKREEIDAIFAAVREDPPESLGEWLGKNAAELAKAWGR
ncbi:MAG: hypothetical protein N2441_06450 [Rhodocyclaceae bacterium]|nr:hypothetical protein [Rhodocyclaceae bacterium]